METAEITRHYLKHFFGDKVSLEHHDMADEKEKASFQTLLDKVPEGYMYYPLVFLNDELALVASAEYYEILGVVREALEQEPQARN